MALDTRFTRLVGCEVPIQLAPMGGIVTPEMIEAVTVAGGMGMYAMPMAPAEAVGKALDAIGLFAKGPFGFNVLVPFLAEDVVEAAASHCALVDFYHGPPTERLVGLVHDGGALAGWQVCSVDHAAAAADAGCDLLVVRGVEGGGRMYGDRSLWPLLFDVLDAVGDRVPVLAAGGIGTGRGVAAALAAGADGVRLGTRFLAASESNAHSRYKQAVIDATAGDTTLTDAYRVMWPEGEPAWSRVLSRSLVAADAADEGPVATVPVGGRELDVPRFGLPAPTAQTTGNVEAMAMYAGESAAAVPGTESAGDVVRRLAREAEALLVRP